MRSVLWKVKAQCGTFILYGFINKWQYVLCMPQTHAACDWIKLNELQLYMHCYSVGMVNLNLPSTAQVSLHWVLQVLCPYYRCQPVAV